MREADLDDLAARLEPLARRSSPFGGRQPPKQARFVEPELVVRVEYGEWTRTRTVRAPVFAGLVAGGDPAAVTWSSAAGG